MGAEPMTDDNESERRPAKPTEWTYRDYRETVELHADVALTHLEGFETVHDAVEYATQDSPMYQNYGQMLMTVLLSDQSPEVPDYGQRWSAHIDLGREDPPTWSECVSEMARVCFYSDVMEQVQRRLDDEDGDGDLSGLVRVDDGDGEGE